MTNELEKIWDSVQGLLSKKLKGPSYGTWIKPSRLIALEDDKAVVAVKNEFNKNFLNQCYLDKIQDAIEKTLKRKIKLEITVKSDLKLEEFVPSIATLADKSEESTNGKEQIANNKEVFLDHTFSYRGNLNPTYTFENFVVGGNNQFCHAAALAIAESSNNSYNPFFIYSGVGLGKTHLINAIANYALDQNNTKNVKYLSSEAFTNELIHSIRTDSMSNFRNKYRNVDILMIDDIQFLEGKEATQEEFFHTFNTLKECGKQIILTADRPPSSLSSITDRLRSRFEGGLIADIQSPDLETRIAILMLKALVLNVELDEEVAEYMATVYSENIRELEGSLKRVHAYLSFTGESVTLQNVKKILGNSSAQAVSPEKVLQAIAAFYKISVNDLVSTKRSSHLTTPRHIAVYVLHDYYNLSFPRIGELMSKRTHSSAVYAYGQVKKKLATSPELSEQISTIRGLVEKRR